MKKNTVGFIYFIKSLIVITLVEVKMCFGRFVIVCLQLKEPSEGRLGLGPQVKSLIQFWTQTTQRSTGRWGVPSTSPRTTDARKTCTYNDETTRKGRKTCTYNGETTRKGVTICTYYGKTTGKSNNNQQKTMQDLVFTVRHVIERIQTQIYCNIVSK